MDQRTPLPPAILLGGESGGAISVARSLGRSGVEVYLLGEPGRPYPERYSRFVRFVPLPADAPAGRAWTEYLLGPESDHLRGAVLLSCSDVGIELILKNRTRLSEKYALDISHPEAQECALNKVCTYVKASEAGVPVPRFWHTECLDDLHAVRDELVYPLLVKPAYSHLFTPVYGEKFLVAYDFQSLCEAFADVRERGLDVVLLEMIPGPDDRLCSYFTYIDESGSFLLDFTKRVIRRYPETKGLGCYHITDWNPEAARLGRRLFAHIGLRGLGNVEFKRDPRDGKLKVMEINARFTAANGLVAASGYDLGLLVYNRLAGRPQAPLDRGGYRTGLRLWYPKNDTKAFLQLHKKGSLTFASWLISILHPQVLPYFRWDDPAPATIGALWFLRHRVKRVAQHLFRATLE
jgi:D-aspartate ligase